jgi:hypothetical protein
MIVKALALASVLMAVQDRAAQDGAISFTFAPRKGLAAGETWFRIEPDGTLTIKNNTAVLDPQAPPTETVIRTVGPGGYRRIAALMAPIRRWKNEAPCPKPEFASDTVSQALASLDMTVFGTVRWDADDMQVKVPITCGDGPARDDIELVRTAIDQMRTWADQGNDDGGFDAAANAIEVPVPAGED